MRGFRLQPSVQSSGPPSPPRPGPLPGASPGSTRGQPHPAACAAATARGQPGGSQRPHLKNKLDSIKRSGSPRARDGSRPVRSAVCRDSQQRVLSEERQRGRKGTVHYTGAPSAGDHWPSRGSSPFVGSRSPFCWGPLAKQRLQPLRRVQKLARQTKGSNFSKSTTINIKAKPRHSGRKVQGGGDVQVPMAIRAHARQEPTQHCKASIRQLRNKKSRTLRINLPAGDGGQ